MASDSNWILAEFEGTYKSAHPDGYKGRYIVKPFRCRVEMERQFLDAYSLNGPFSTYYKDEVKKLYPDMIDLHQFKLVEATELDGSVIDHPHAFSHENAIKYIKEKKYPINTVLYNSTEIRHEIKLYEEDPKGQQKGQGMRERHHGAELSVSHKIRERQARVEALPVGEEKQKVVEQSNKKNGAKSVNEGTK